MSKPEKKALVPTLRFPEFRDKGEWDADELGEIAEFVNEKIPLERITLENYVSTENILPDYGGVARASKLPAMGSVTRFRTHDTLVSNIRPYLKKVWVADKAGGASNDVIVIRAKRRLLPQYFSFLIRNDAFIDYVMTGAKGVKMPRGDIGAMKEYPALYPTKTEQQKIADCLTSIEVQITAQTQRLGALKTHKKGLMQQLFTVEGETVPKRRFPEFRDKGEWETKRLDDFAVIVRGGSPRPIDEYITNNSDGLHWLKIGDIDKESKYVTSTQDKVIPAALSKTRVVNPGDLILSNSMSFGRPYILKIKTCIHDGWIAVSEIDKILDRDYLYYLMMTSTSQTYFSNNAAGSGVQNLNADIIKLLPVSYPGKKEQQKIADCLTSIDELISAETQKLDALKAHKKGLMQQLFPAMDKVSA